MSMFVGVTSYNTKEYVTNCLDGLFGWPSKPARVHVVDNGSQDGTQEMLASRPEAEVTWEQCSENTAASGGTRRAVDRFLSEAGCDIFLHLDADTDIRGDALGSLIDQVSGRPRVAIGVRVDKLRYQHPRSRSLRAFDSYIFGDWRRKHAPDIDDVEFERRMLIETHGMRVYRELCGWFLAMPRQLIDEIGNVDDCRFKMWRWESEWVLRATARDYPVEHAEAVSAGLVHHFGGVSRGREENPHRYDRRLREDLT